MYKTLFLSLALFCCNTLAIDLPQEKLDEIELKVKNLHGTELQKKQLRISETKQAKLELKQLKQEALSTRRAAIKELKQAKLELQRGEVKAAKLSMFKGHHPKNCKEKIHDHKPKLNVKIDGHNCDIHGPESRHLVCGETRKNCAIDTNCGYWSFVAKPIANSPHRYYWVNRDSSAFCLLNPESKKCGGNKWVSVEKAIPNDSACAVFDEFLDAPPSKMTPEELKSFIEASKACRGSL